MKKQITSISCLLIGLGGLQAQYPVGTVHCNAIPTEIRDVTSVTGAVWMDRNLGASQVATSSNDADAYGDLYQWGRFADGHQCRTSGTTPTLSATDTPGHANFITGSLDWRSSPNNNLWQGVNGTNNPCPSGYRLPTATEWTAERTSWTINTATGAYASPLKLSIAGDRNQTAALNSVGNSGAYWVDASRSLYFDSGFAGTFNDDRLSGNSVRCIKHVYPVGLNEDNNKIEWSVYPNPTTDYIILNGAESTNLSYQLIDVKGKIIESKTVTNNATKISLQGQPVATYFLKVTQNNQLVKTFTIIKN